MISVCAFWTYSNFFHSLLKLYCSYSNFGKVCSKRALVLQDENVINHMATNIKNSRAWRLVFNNK